MSAICRNSISAKKGALPVPGDAIESLTRVDFDIVDELLNRMGGRGVRHEHKIDKLGDERDWRKIRNRIVAERTVETGVHREGCCGKQDRVSIRIGSCGVFVANV